MHCTRSLALAINKQNYVLVYAFHFVIQSGCSEYDELMMHMLLGQNSLKRFYTTMNWFARVFLVIYVLISGQAARRSFPYFGRDVG